MALTVRVVVLERPEETCGALVKCVGSSEEFWTGPHFTSEKEITNMVKKLVNMAFANHFTSII